MIRHRPEVSIEKWVKAERQNPWRFIRDEGNAATSCLARCLGLAREMRKRCDLFDSGQWPGTQLVPNWYPVPVTYLPDGAVRDETDAEFGPGQPW